MPEVNLLCIYLNLIFDSKVIIGSPNICHLNIVVIISNRRARPIKLYSKFLVKNSTNSCIHYVSTVPLDCFRHGICFSKTTLKLSTQ